jgi:hypothetical protein
MRARMRRSYIRTLFATGGAGKARLDIRQPDVIRPAVGADLDVVATFVIAAIDGACRTRAV